MKSVVSNDSSKSAVKTKSYNHSYNKKPGPLSRPNREQEAKQPQKRQRDNDLLKKQQDTFNVMDMMDSMKRKQEEERKRKQGLEFSDVKAREQQKALLSKKVTTGPSSAASEPQKASEPKEAGDQSPNPEDLQKLMRMRVQQNSTGRMFKAFTTWNDGFNDIYKCWVCSVEVRRPLF